ncbi:hypothetical protein GBAR_LOCUS24692 [Geodia barretti]|nr:hypothetical protein GBAR_LOCUS24692 [Geodia barretti]
MMCYTDWMTLVEKDDGRADELWVLTDEDLWLVGKTLKVRFLDDRIPAWPNDGRGHITEEEILKIANEWHQCGVEQGKDVVPEFVPCGADDTADIRVKFIVDSGCPRSKVGTAATRVKAGDPTMWLDLKSPDNCPSLYKRTIRHEFGHALDLKHEHQHPDAPPLTDPRKLKEYLTQRLPPAEIDEKIRVQWAALARGASQKSKYDKESVMHYLIPEVVRANKYVGPTELPIELSDCDKTNIVLFYSKDTGSGTDRDDGPGGSIVDDSGENGSKGNIKPEDFASFPRPKLVDLINIVGVRVKVKWRSIGLGLGFKDWELNGIYATKCRELDPPQECMTEGFSQWKSGLKSEYSWKKLAEVLVLPAVNEIELSGSYVPKLTNKK